MDGWRAFGIGRQGEQLAVDGSINQDVAALRGGAADGDGAGFDGRVPVDAADELGQAGGLAGGLAWAARGRAAADRMRASLMACMAVSFYAGWRLPENCGLALALQKLR